MLDLGSENYMQLINDFWLTGCDKLQKTFKVQSHLELFKEFSCVELSHFSRNLQFKISNAGENRFNWATWVRFTGQQKFLGLKVTSAWAQTAKFCTFIMSNLVNVLTVNFYASHHTLCRTAGIALNQCVSDEVTPNIFRYYTCLFVDEDLAMKR